MLLHSSVCVCLVEGPNKCFTKSCDVSFVTPLTLFMQSQEERWGWEVAVVVVVGRTTYWLHVQTLIEQMGFMKITVARINKTDDSRCQSIHANILIDFLLLISLAPPRLWLRWVHIFVFDDGIQTVISPPACQNRCCLL